jgi:hydantoinase/carbamoylase family amidase
MTEGLNADRIWDRIEELFSLAPDAGGGATRLAFSEAEAEAMRLVASWMTEEGLEVSLDPCGNLWGLPSGWDGTMIVTSGSHVDTVPNGGRFDGALGTVLSLEAAASLSGPFGVLICAAEEAARFGAGTIGSRTLTDKLSDEDLSRMHDRNGKSALEARAEYLAALQGLPRLESHPHLAAHIEAHIEQRKELKKWGAALGIATTIAGPTRHKLRFLGEVAHVGETPVDERHDALCAASEVVLLAERLAHKFTPKVVATVGTVRVHPNSLTSIPGEVEIGVDVRSVEAWRASGLLDELLAGAESASQRRSVTLTDEPLSVAEPVALDTRVIEVVESVCRRLGIRAERCVSFAGHDVQHLAEKIPAALIFVPSTNGVSHAPQESVNRSDVESTLKVLVSLLPELLSIYQRKEN